MRYARLIAEFYNTPLLVQDVKAQAIADAMTRSLFSGQLHEEDFDLTVEALQRPDSNGGEAPKAGLVYVLGSIATRHNAGLSNSGTAYSGIRRDVEALIADGAETIGFVINSPGGALAGFTETHDYIASLPQRGIRTFAFVEGTAASAAYGLASATQKIYGTESSELGSIGVLTVHVDTTKADEEAGYSYEIFRSRNRKARGASFESLDETYRAELSAKLEEADRIFVSAIRSSRVSLSEKTINSLDGRTVLGNEAVKLNLMDQVVAGLEEVWRLESKSSSAAQRETFMTAETPEKTVAEEPQITQADVDSAVSAAVQTERERTLGILGAAETLRIGLDKVRAHVEKGYSLEVSKEIMTAIAEAQQPEVDAHVETSGVTDENGNTAADNISSLLSSYSAATGQTFGGEV